MATPKRALRLEPARWQETGTLVKREAPDFVLWPLAIEHQGRRQPDAPLATEVESWPMAGSSGTLEVIPLLDHAGAEASSWLQARAVGASPLASPTTGRAPVPMAPVDWREVQKQVRLAGEHLFALGVRQVALAMDDDSLFAHQMSVRHRPNDDEATRLAPMVDAIRALIKMGFNVGVTFTAEEKCPGGNDLTDGISAARILEAAGISFLVASVGTAAFMPLKNPPLRGLKKGESTLDQELSPQLFSAATISDALTIPVYGQVHLHGVAGAMKQAAALGLAGVVFPEQISAEARP